MSVRLLLELCSLLQILRHRCGGDCEAYVFVSVHQVAIVFSSVVGYSVQCHFFYGNGGRVLLVAINPVEDSGCVLQVTLCSAGKSFKIRVSLSTDLARYVLLRM